MNKKSYIEGLISGALASTIWGFLPLYWRLVNAINPYDIFSHRVVWSFLFIFILLLIKRNWSDFLSVIRDKQEWKNIIAPAFFISVNWLLYIWAVNNGYVIEASLGYFISPLVVTLFGSVFFKEKLSGLQIIGLLFAAAGVVIKTLLYGRVPVIALTLSISFALYGLFKKKSKLNSLAGLGFETLVMGIPSLIFIIFSESRGLGISGNLPWTFWLLIALSGIVSSIPLLLYAESTKRLPLNTVGFLQYLSPTISLLIGIYIFKEPFDASSLYAFSFIWIGLILFTYLQYKLLRKKKAGISDIADSEIHLNSL